MFYALPSFLFYKIAQYDMHFEAQGGWTLIKGGWTYGWLNFMQL